MRLQDLAQPRTGDPREIALSQLVTPHFIGENEGFRTGIYKDSLGIDSVGTGFNIKDETVRSLLPEEVLSGKREITKEENDQVLGVLTERAGSDAKNFVGEDIYNNLSRTQRLALTDMAYNLGSTRLGKFEKLRTALQSGNNEQAKLEVLDSKYAKQVPGRALRNANLMLK